MMIAPRRHQHRSRGTNRHSDVAVTVNFNAEFILMSVEPIIECFSRDFIWEYYPGLEASAVPTVPPIVVKTLPSSSNKSLPCLPLHIHAKIIIPTFSTSNIYIGLFLPKALTLTRHQSYQMFEVLLIVRINNSVGLWGIHNFRLLRDAFPYRLARGIPLMEGVP
jgi:hypothetical protein